MYVLLYEEENEESDFALDLSELVSLRMMWMKTGINL